MNLIKNEFFKKCHLSEEDINKNKIEWDVLNRDLTQIKEKYEKIIDLKDKEIDKLKE